jgi:hypothetical protein
MKYASQTSIWDFLAQGVTASPAGKHQLFWHKVVHFLFQASFAFILSNPDLGSKYQSTELIESGFNPDSQRSF